MTPDLAPAVLDALGTHIAVLDAEGRITYVNRAWCEFSLANGGPDASGWLGRSYLAVCEGSTSPADPWPAMAAEGIRSVQTGLRRSYVIEYPCHSPVEQRWFAMRVHPLQAAGMPGACVVAHDDITERILAELRLIELHGTDPLTRLSTWRLFEQQWAVEWGRGMRVQRRMLLLRVAFDEAESLGSTCDAALRAVAEALRDQARRPGDFAARAKGASCVLLLAGAPLDTATAINEALQTRLAQSPVRAEIESQGACSVRALLALPQPGLEPATVLANMMQCLSAPEAMAAGADLRLNLHTSATAQHR